MSPKSKGAESKYSAPFDIHMARLKKGFTLIEVMIVVAVIAILLSIALPNMFAHRKTSQMMACLANIEMLNRASEAYIIKNDSPDDFEITLNMLVPTDSTDAATRSKYFIMYMPVCPTGGSYSYLSAQHTWRCSLGGDSEANGGYPHGK